MMLQICFYLASLHKSGAVFLSTMGMNISDRDSKSNEVVLINID